jgi:hypothetical protein
MAGRAFVLEAEPVGSEGRCVSGWLAALGIDWSPCMPEQILSGELARGGVKPSLLVSWAALAQLDETVGRRGGSLERTLQPFDKICVHTFDPAVVTPELLRHLTGCTGAQAAPCGPGESKYRVSPSHRRIAGAFSGLESSPVQPQTDFTLALTAPNREIDYLISIDGKGLLTRVRGGSADLFLISSTRVVDVAHPCRANVDVRVHFSSVVPILLFLRHAFGDTSWQPRANFANLIVDDALLRPRYGFLKTVDLADAVRDLGIAATIAFIPWNYRRSDKKILSLFARTFPALAICAHGCSHTKGEFGGSDSAYLAQLSHLARHRMEAQQAITGLGFEKVMVFPQGSFSAEALRGLRAGGFLAAVNNEVMDESRGEGIRFKDLLQPAVICHGGVPLFVRRNAEDDVVNFAFDIFIGKPCLIEAHHDFFRNGMRPLRDLVRRLDALEGRLRWTNLENLVRQSFALKQGPEGRRRIRLYSDASVIEPLAADREEEVEFVQEENNGDAIQSVTVGGRRVAFSLAGGVLSFEARLHSRSSTPVEIRRDPWSSSLNTFTERTSASRIAARRYLCEFRDNYLSRSRQALRLVAALRRCLK